MDSCSGLVSFWRLLKLCPEKSMNNEAVSHYFGGRNNDTSLVGENFKQIHNDYIILLKCTQTRILISRIFIS